MKVLALSVGCSLLAATVLFAIPQNFSSGGNFARRAGMRFEEFAAEKETWSAATLKGEWSGVGENGEQVLKDDAVVFGLPAATIKADRSSGGVQRFLVSFRSEGGKAARVPLFEQVTQNVRSFTGEAGKPSGRQAHTFRHKGGVQITVRNKSAREVEVEFRPGT